MFKAVTSVTNALGHAVGNAVDYASTKITGVDKAFMDELHLEKSVFQDREITDKEVSYIAKQLASTGCHTKSLTIKTAQLKMSDALVLLSALETNTSLHTLDLSYNNIKKPDNGSYTKICKGIKRLKKLDLSNNKRLDIDLVCSLIENSCIQELDIRDIENWEDHVKRLLPLVEKNIYLTSFHYYPEGFNTKLNKDTVLLDNYIYRNKRFFNLQKSFEHQIKNISEIQFFHGQKFNENALPWLKSAIDNADRALNSIASSEKFMPDKRYESFRSIQKSLETFLKLLEKCFLSCQVLDQNNDNINYVNSLITDTKELRDYTEKLDDINFKPLKEFVTTIVSVIRNNTMEIRMQEYIAEKNVIIELIDKFSIFTSENVFDENLRESYSNIYIKLQNLRAKNTTNDQGSQLFKNVDNLLLEVEKHLTSRLDNILNDFIKKIKARVENLKNGNLIHFNLDEEENNINKQLEKVCYFLETFKSHKAEEKMKELKKIQDALPGQLSKAAQAILEKFKEQALNLRIDFVDAKSLEAYKNQLTQYKSTLLGIQLIRGKYKTNLGNDFDKFCQEMHFKLINYQKICEIATPLLALKAEIEGYPKYKVGFWGAGYLGGTSKLIAGQERKIPKTAALILTKINAALFNDRNLEAISPENADKIISVWQQCAKGCDATGEKGVAYLLQHWHKRGKWKAWRNPETTKFVKDLQSKYFVP